MLKKLFTVFDVKAEAYMNPFVADSTGLAIRTFADIANDPKHPIGEHPEDYTLFEIGTYDPLTGMVEKLKTHKPLGIGIEFMEPIYSDPKLGDISKVS